MWQYFNSKFEYEETFQDFDRPWAGHKYFAYDLIRNVKPKVIVELGTHKGTSFFTFCQAVKDENYDANIYAIDTWRGDKHTGFYDDNIFKEINEIKEKYYGSLKIKLLRKTFDEASEDFEKDTIDLLHIDGLHTYAAVRHDFENWFPKVKKEGIILLHDIFINRYDFGVYKLWEEVKTKHKTIEFYQSYGLGVLFKGYNAYHHIKDREKDFQIRYSYIAEDKKNEGIKKFFHETNKSVKTYDSQVKNLDQMVVVLEQSLTNRKSQIENLNKLLTERNGHIARCNEAIRTLTVCLEEKEKALAERDEQIANLNQTLINRDTTLMKIQRSTIWRLSAPLRWYGCQKRRLGILLSIMPSMLLVAGGALPLFKRAASVWRHNGIDGIKFAVRNFIQKIEQHKTVLSFPIFNPRVNDYENYLVTILILTKNRIDLIKPCIESIEKNLSKKYKIEIIIGDTGSTEKKVWDFYKKVISKFSNIKVTRLKNYFFSKNYNELIRHHANGKFLILLNNDTIVKEDWIDALVDPLEDKRIGIVGGKLLYENDTIQHAGMEFNTMGNGIHRFRGESKDMEEASYKAFTPAVTFACVAMRHDVYDRFQLSEEFKEEGQDSDFCMRLSEAGFKILYNPSAEVYHLECSSRDFKKGKQDRLLLTEKWGNTIREYANKKKQSVRFDEDEYKNAIVIVRDDGIGDLLMGVSAFNNLRKKYPDKKLVLMTYQRNIEMMSGFKIFDEIIPIPNGKKYLPLPIPTVGTEVYNLIDFEMHFGQNWGKTKETNKVPRHISFCNVLDVNDEYELLKMPDYPKAKEKIIKLINKAGFKENNNFVVLNMLASNPARSWWEPYYPQLISAIEEIGFIPVIVGTKSCEYYRGNAIINLTEKTDTITEYIEALKLGKYIVSTDTSAYHVAALSKIPFLAIFTGGITPESRLSFYSNYEFVEPSKELDCYPCWDEGCKDLSVRWKREPCRLSIKPEDVINKFRKLVGAM